MKSIKNFFVGIVVSFAGSLPLGYLNVIASIIFVSKGLLPVLEFIGGVIVVEAIVIYFTITGAVWLTSRIVLMKWIQYFTIFFLIALAIIFFLQPPNIGSQNDTELNTSAINYFIKGLGLSAINFIQIPFWSGWNIYLVTNKWLNTEKYLRIVYVIGAIVGTTIGMITFVYVASYALEKGSGVLQNISNYFLPGIFLLMALFHLIQLIRKKD